MATKAHNKTQTDHTAAIDALIARTPGMQKKGFWNAVRDLSVELDNECELAKCAFVPDCYLINRETQRIEIHEIVNTSDLRPTKLYEVGYFWFQWDCECDHNWLPVLIAHREGAEPQEYDLCYWYHSYVSEAAAMPREVAYF